VGYHSISIVVPAYNAENFIGRCLESLLALDYPKDKLQITVVDNHSPDQTPALIRRYPVLCLTERTPGAAAARNKGWRSAGGEIVASTDADCVLDTNWAREINRTFQDPQVDAVMGFTEGINENFWACLEQKNFEEFWFCKTDQGYSLKRVGVDTRNCAIRKKVLKECGYLNADLPFCEDLDLSVKLRARKSGVVFNEKMRAWHHNRTDLGRILRIKEDHARAYLQIVAQQPGGFDCPDLPVDFRTFLGVSNWWVRGLGLESALVGLRLLRSLMIMGLRALSATMATPNGLALKIFKTVCGASWEIAILNEIRQRHA